jgi:hypothetical protein
MICEACRDTGYTVDFSGAVKCCHCETWMKTHAAEVLMSEEVITSDDDAYQVRVTTDFNLGVKTVTVTHRGSGYTFPPVVVITENER